MKSLFRPPQLKAPEGIHFLSLRRALAKPKSQEDLRKAIVNAPFKDKGFAASLGLGIIVLLVVNKKERTIDRVALSDTIQASGAVQVSVKPFKQIKIPLRNKENTVALAIGSGEPKHTNDWKYLFIPALKPDEARLNQAGAGITHSAVYPLKVDGGAALIFSFFLTSEDVGPRQTSFMEKYSTLVAQALK